MNFHFLKKLFKRGADSVDKKQKITQLSFSELRIKEKHSLKKRFSRFFSFLAFLAFYFNRKQKKSKNLFLSSCDKLFRSIYRLKGSITIKLIWGRGRLGKPVLHVGILVLAGLVFLTGGLFQRKFIVLSSEERELFISSPSDIVPQTVVLATTDSNSTDRDQIIEYTVKSGDTLSSIGKKFGVSVDTIRYANNLSDASYLDVGDALDIPPVNGVVYEVKAGDTIENISDRFDVSSQAIADFNYLAKPFILEEGQTLVLPDASIPAPVVASTPPAQTSSDSSPPGSYSGSSYTFIPYASDGSVGSGSFIWPTNSRYITQYFSWYHPAVDIAMSSPIYASDTGVVVRSGWWTNGYGFAIQVDHRNGYVTTYAHMSQLHVSVGDEVSQGQVLGMMGSTGRSTGTHVHFTIQQNGQFLNPMDFF